MDTKFLRKRAKTVKSIEEFLAYCTERDYSDSIVTLKAMLEETKKIHPKEIDVNDQPGFLLRYKNPSIELRQIHAVIMILRYILNEHTFLTLAPKTIGKSVTVTGTNEIEVKYQIEFECSWINAEIYKTTITVNPKWVIRISTIVANKQFRSMKINSNFDKDYFGLETVDKEFVFKDPLVRVEASDFIHKHLHDVAEVIQKFSI